MSASTAGWNLILGCDLPHLTSGWIEWLIARTLKSSAQAIVPKSRRGLEPLAAVYRKDCLLVFSTALARGIKRVSVAVGGIFIEEVMVSRSNDLSTDMFFNMNTPKDFVEARGRLSVVGDSASLCDRGWTETEHRKRIIMLEN